MVDITPAQFKTSRAGRGSHHRYDPVAKLLQISQVVKFHFSHRASRG